MARTRNIKPAFFANDELAELCPYTRLFFIGLWTVADKEGRLEDRPKKLKAAIFPYEEIDCNELAAKLHGKKFIRRYKVDGQCFIEITNFKKHQNPHPKEQASTIPEPAEICEAVELHDKPCKEHDLPCLLSIPSLSNPSSSNIPKPRKVTARKPMDVSDQVWDDFITHRKAKKASITQTVINGYRTEADKAGFTLEQALMHSITQGWQGFKADWVTKGTTNGQLTHAQRKQLALDSIPDEETPHEHHESPDFTELRYIPDLRETT
jgi:hypothetical protein